MPAQQTAPGPRRSPGAPARQRNVVADLTAAVLLLLAPLLPWNLYFGIAIPDSNTTVFAVLIAVTLLSLIAIALPGCPGGQPAGFGCALNAPYLLLVLAFVGFDVFETVRFGGTVTVPGGVGPGAWLGVAGALLSTQSVITGAATADDDTSERAAAVRPDHRLRVDVGRSAELWLHPVLAGEVRVGRHVRPASASKTSRSSRRRRCTAWWR